MRRRASIGPIFFSVLALALTGCEVGVTGPSPTDPHITTTIALATTTTLTVEEGLANYRSCLSGEGVSIGEIPRDGLGRPRMAYALQGLDLSDRDVLDALDDCGHHLVSGALDLKADPELREMVQNSLEEFASCLRLEGVTDYPDPVPGFDGVGSPFPVDRVPWTDPDLAEAVVKCMSVLGA